MKTDLQALSMTISFCIAILSVVSTVINLWLTAKMAPYVTNQKLMDQRLVALETQKTESEKNGEKIAVLDERTKNTNMKIENLELKIDRIFDRVK
jgi:hypothetical protein